MDFKLENGTINIKMSGRLDSNNYHEVEDELNKILSTNKFENIVLDFENMEYVSSAGLRVILKAKKTYLNLVIENVSTDLYEIFEMTGFSEIIEIKKAFRKFDVSGCKLIAKGMNGEVYRLDEDSIIKVYISGDALSDIERERELARTAFVLGIPTAISFDVVKVGDKYGAIFELLDCNVLSKEIVQNHDKLDHYINEYANFLTQLHSTVAKSDVVPNIKDTVISWVKDVKNDLDDAHYNKLEKLINDVPNALTLVHGDCHIRNLMVQNGELLLIDMDTLSKGHPIFEFGALYSAYKGYPELNHQTIGEFFGMEDDDIEKLWHDTRSIYLKTDDENKLAEFENKCKVVSFLRIFRRTIKKNTNDEDGKDKYNRMKIRLCEAIDNVDTLIF